MAMPLIQLQRLAGNAAVGELIARRRVQRQGDGNADDAEAAAFDIGAVGALLRQVDGGEQQPIVCATPLADAEEIETAAARETLSLSARTANQYLRNVGAVGARGRFVPTVI